MLILVRELPNPPEKVWQVRTDPAHLREWAPFDADGSLGTVGTTMKLTTDGSVRAACFRNLSTSKQMCHPAAPIEMKQRSMLVHSVRLMPPAKATSSHRISRVGP
jgi:hypothetical protein